MFQAEIVEEIKIRISYSFFFLFRKSCRIWDVEKYCRARHATDDIMAHAHLCSVTKATDTRSGYVILTAFPLQQQLRERSMLRYTYIACLVLNFFTTFRGKYLALYIWPVIYYKGQHSVVLVDWNLRVSERNKRKEAKGVWLIPAS